MKVITRVKGGLGNQLFCYAAAYRLSKMNNAELVIDHVSGFTYDKIYKRKYALHHFNLSGRLASPAERLEPFSRIRRKLVQEMEKKKEFTRRKYIVEERNEFDPRILQIRPAKNIYLDGYWQSEHYFSDVAGEINNEFEIIAPVDQANIRMDVSITTSEAVMLHVRWFDDSPNGDANISLRYYENAIKCLSERLTDLHYFVFSDKPADAVKLLEGLNQKFTIVSHNMDKENAYADLWLMSKCKYFITANSTFSWWGAWLSQYSNKIVLTPAMKISPLSAWGFKGLIPDGWVQL